MRGWLLAAALVASLTSCKLLSEPVLMQGPLGPDGVAPPPVPVIQADGTDYTVGEYLADQIQAQTPPAAGLLSDALSAPLGGLAGILGAVLVGVAAALAGALRSRFPGERDEEPPADPPAEG